MRHSSRRLLERWLTGALLATSIFLAGATFLAPASAQAAQSEKVVARIGHLEIIDPFLPDPASPDVAAAYLTVSEIFPMEMRGMAIALFYATGTLIGGVAGGGQLDADDGERAWLGRNDGDAA